MSATNNINVPFAHIATTSTPQNTPANAAPISSRAQQPGVDSIKEGKCSSFRVAAPHPSPTVRQS